jgi:hypothetical protein
LQVQIFHMEIMPTDSTVSKYFEYIEVSNDDAKLQVKPTVISKNKPIIDIIATPNSVVILEMITSTGQIVLRQHFTMETCKKKVTLDFKNSYIGACFLYLSSKSGSAVCKILLME